MASSKPQDSQQLKQRNTGQSDKALFEQPEEIYSQQKNSASAYQEDRQS
jgi:hypothetical protein